MVFTDRDGTIVSGDSLGGVRFWDGKTGTEMQSFRNHGADVLCVAVAPVSSNSSPSYVVSNSDYAQDGDSVFTSGIDQKTCFYTHVRAPPSSSDKEDDDEDTLGASVLFKPKRDKWIFSSEKRMHSHDVRAMVIWPPHVLLSAPRLVLNSHLAPVLVSGGLDMNVVLAPCASISPSTSMSAGQPVKIINPLATSAACTFEDAYHCRMAYSLGLTPAVQMASGRGLMVCRRDEGVSVWRMGRGVGVPGLGLGDLSIRDLTQMDVDPGADDDGELKPRKKKPRGKKRLIKAQMEAENLERRRNEPGYVKVMDVEVEGLKTNLVTSAISEDGTWLAVADLYETRLFYLREEVSYWFCLILDLSSDARVFGQRGRMEYEEFEEFGELMKSCLGSDASTSSSSSSDPSSSSASAPSIGSSAIAFSPDSSKMVLATTFGAVVCVFDLGIHFESPMKAINANGEEEDLEDEEGGGGDGGGEGTVTPNVRFSTKFRQHGLKMGRVIRPLPQSSMGTPGTPVSPAVNKSPSKSNTGRGARMNGARDSDGSSDEAASDGENEGDVLGVEGEERVDGVKVTKVVFSADGQWCASSDDRRRTYVYNMDSVKVRSRFVYILLCTAD